MRDIGGNKYGVRLCLDLRTGRVCLKRGKQTLEIDGKPYLTGQTEASVLQIAFKLAPGGVTIRKRRGLIRYHLLGKLAVLGGTVARGRGKRYAKQRRRHR